MTGPNGASAAFVGQVAEHGTDDWTTVVTDPDREYVAYCLRWQGYGLLRRRVTPAPSPEAGESRG